MSSSATLDQQAQVFISPDDRKLILGEAKADPLFARYLSRMLSLPDGEAQVVNYAKQAILNQLNPKVYPQTAGQWPKLRSIVQSLITEIPKAIHDSIQGLPLDQKIQAIESIAKGKGLNVPFDLGDLGQLDIIASLVTTAIGAATNIYTSTLQSSTAKQIAAMQLQANEQAIQAQEAQSKAQIAISNAQATQALQSTLPAPLASAAVTAIQALPTALQAPVSSVVSVLSADVGGGIPLWAVGGVIYLIVNRNKK